MSSIKDVLFQAIVQEVMEKEDSPYKQLLKKVNDIDVEYFEEIPRNGEKMDSRLNVELKTEVVGVIEQMADELLLKSGLQQKIMTELNAQIEAAKQKESAEVVAEDVKALVERLTKFAQGNLFFLPKAPFTEKELKDKWRKAKNITLLESVFTSNSPDIIDFYHSLLRQTEWECKNLVEIRIQGFIMAIAYQLAK